MHAYGAHGEYGLRRVEDADGRPDGCDPEPLWQLSVGARRFHRENRILRLCRYGRKCSEVLVGCSGRSSQKEESSAILAVMISKMVLGALGVTVLALPN